MDKRKVNHTRPPKLYAPDQREILRSVPELQKPVGSFTSPRIALKAGVSPNVSNRTVG